MANQFPPFRKNPAQPTRAQQLARDRKRRQRVKERAAGRHSLLVTLPQAVHQKTAFLTLVHRQDETVAGLVAKLIEIQVEADVTRYGNLFDELSTHWREIKAYLTKAVPLIRNPRVESISVYGVQYTSKRWTELTPIFSRIVTRFRSLGYTNDKELVRLLNKHFAAGSPLPHQAQPLL